MGVALRPMRDAPTCPVAPPKADGMGFGVRTAQGNSRAKMVRGAQFSNSSASLTLASLRKLE